MFGRVPRISHLIKLETRNGFVPPIFRCPVGWRMTTRHHHLWSNRWPAQLEVPGRASRRQPISVVRSHSSTLCRHQTSLTSCSIVIHTRRREKDLIKNQRLLLRRWTASKKNDWFSVQSKREKSRCSFSTLFSRVCQLKKYIFLLHDEWRRKKERNVEHFLSISWMEEAHTATAQHENKIPSPQTQKLNRSQCHTRNETTENVRVNRLTTSNPSCIVSIYDTKSQ